MNRPSGIYPVINIIYTGYKNNHVVDL